MKMDMTITLLEILTFAGILITIVIFALTYVSSKRQDRKLAHRQIYQRLELASIGVFQNEIDHPQLADIGLHSRNELKSKAGSLPLNAYDAYLYQQLNLFEMAYSFCREDLMPQEVFGSWVIWFGDLCALPYFRDFWIGKDAVAPLNYVPGFRKVMTVGCEIYGDESLSLQEKRDRFFKFVGQQIDSRVVSEWLKTI